MKELIWKIRFVDKTFRHPENDTDTKWLREDTCAEKAVSEVFANFVKKPYGGIELIYSEEYWDDVYAVGDQMLEDMEEQAMSQDFLDEEEVWGDNDEEMDEMEALVEELFG